MEYVHTADEVDMWQKCVIERHVKEQYPETQRALLEMSKRAGQSLTMRGATEERNNKQQVKAKVYALDGLPVDTEAEAVEAILNSHNQVNHNERSAFRLCLWSPIIAVHVLFNLGVEAALMCLDSLRLPSCIRTPHLTQDEQRRSKLLFILVPRGTQIP
ncbi:hypothetical protein M9H77_31997 [Catharanthus roseus]|uniref:Uncharacterized protein n=1 Tax=Catharanthus roseus TaxID=4058 RepID=A0ACC0A2P7_CATRO|nr:hypothetical protein M9H77_31997 [Catharanthus roseus]